MWFSRPKQILGRIPNIFHTPPLMLSWWRKFKQTNRKSFFKVCLIKNLKSSTLEKHFSRFPCVGSKLRLFHVYIFHTLNMRIRFFLYVLSDVFQTCIVVMCSQYPRLGFLQSLVLEKPNLLFPFSSPLFFRERLEENAGIRQTGQKHLLGHESLVHNSEKCDVAVAKKRFCVVNAKEAVVASLIPSTSVFSLLLCIPGTFDWKYAENSMFL